MRFKDGIERKRYGLSRVVKGVKEVLLEEKELYDVWLRLSEYKREMIERRIREVVRKELLDKEFYRALVEDVIGEGGEIKVDSCLFEYLRKRVYEGDSRRMLIEFQTRKEDKR